MHSTIGFGQGLRRFGTSRPEKAFHRSVMRKKVFRRQQCELAASLRPFILETFLILLVWAVAPVRTTILTRRITLEFRIGYDAFSACYFSKTFFGNSGRSSLIRHSAALSVFAPGLLALDHTFGGFGEISLVLGRNLGLAGLESLVARDDQRLGLWNFLCSSMLRPSMHLCVIRSPNIRLVLLAEGQRLAHHGLGLGLF